MKTKPIQPGKVLLTCGTSALAQRVAQRFLREEEVRFASAEPIPEVLLKTGPYDQLSASAHPAFIHELLKLALDRGIERVFPLGKSEIDLLGEAHTLFSEYGIQLVSPTREQQTALQWAHHPPAALELEVIWQEATCETTHETSLLGPGLYTKSDDGTYYLCSAD